MHLSINHQKLHEAILRAEKITGKNLSLAILKSVLLIAGKNNLIIRATNLDLGIEIELPAQVQKEGVVAVPGGTLSSLLGRITSKGDVTLAKEEGTLQVTSPGGTAEVNVYPHDDFPTLPTVAGDALSFAPELFISGLKAVWQSASTASMKPELASVYIASSDGELIFAATDAFRLSEKRVALPKKGAAGLGAAVLLPVKNVPEVLRNLEHASGDVSVVLEENQISFMFDTTRLTSRIVDGVFPDYAQIIPKEHTVEITVLTEDIAQALKVSSLFANKFNQVLFNIDPQAKQFTLTTHNKEVGRSTVTLTGALSGDPLDIGFNQKYISDALQLVSTDSVALQFSGPGKPLVIRMVGDHSFIYMVMPMNK